MIKAWTNSKTKVSSIPVIEITKLSELDYGGKDKSYFTKNEEASLVNNDVYYSQVFELKYKDNLSDVHKKFRISLFKSDKRGQNVQIGKPYTISVLTNLDGQGVIFKTFDFGNSSDEVEWSVRTRMQYVNDKETLFKDILRKLEEKQKLLEDIILKAKSQARSKNLVNAPQIGSQFTGNSLISRESHYVPFKERQSSSQHAGYYSSSKSVGYSVENDNYQSSYEVQVFKCQPADAGTESREESKETS